MFLSDLNQEETDALHNYKAAHDSAGHGSFCFDVNELLQSGLWLDELPDAFRRQVTALDRVFARCPTIKQPLTAYRGVGSLSLIEPLRQKRKFRSLSFWSASSSRPVAVSFVKPLVSASAGAILTLRIPCGTPVYDMESLTGVGRSEHEYLLPRGLLWQIEEMAKGDIDQILPTARKNLTSLHLITLQALSPTTRPLSYFCRPD
jgi:hypothetical protein